MLCNWKICSSVFNIRTYDERLCKFNQINETVHKMTYTNFPILCQHPTNTTWKCNTDSFGPFFQFWSVTVKCMRDSKPQRCAQQHKSLKVTRNATNRDQHIKEASKQTFAKNQ